MAGPRCAGTFFDEGGSYLEFHPEFYANTSVTNFRATDPEMEGKDILEMVIPAARRRGMKVIPEMMEPLFEYAGMGRPLQ